MSILVGVVSLGCTKNTVDTEQMLGILQGKGYELTHQPAKADILVVNTCGFIKSAKEESIDTILEMAKFKEAGRCRLLAVTGCLAQRYRDELLSEIPEIDLLMGVNQYDKLAHAIDEAMAGERPVYCASASTFYEGERVLTTASFSAYIKTGDGCDNRCAYCAIPLIRGGYRSRPKEDILSEITELAKKGVREHILVAQDTSRYGTDWQSEPMLPALVEEAAAIPGVHWLRVLYCYPDTTGLPLLDTMAALPNVCRYLDLPIQHISGRLLLKMNRRGSPDKIRDTLLMARERGMALRTSIIVGFPGETEADFEELLRFTAEMEFDRLGAFAFSPEEDTPAATMANQVPEGVKGERLHRLMTQQALISRKRNLARVGSCEEVLVTGREKGGYIGRSRWEAPDIDGQIHFAAKSILAPGRFVQVNITDADTYDLMGVCHEPA